MHRSRLFALFLLGTVVHVESLGYWFVAVDSPKLILSSRIAGWGDAAAIFTQPLMHETEFTTLALFYRPFASLSYSVDYWVWGMDPFGYHLTNLLLQGVAVVSVAVVVGELTRDAAVGQLTAALFALHPLTAEVVPAAPRRHDVFMLIFLLGSLVLFVRSQRERGVSRRDSALYFGGSLVAYVLALGSKEPAVIVPALIFVWTALQHDGDPYRTLWRSVWVTVPFGVLTAAYLAVRVAVLGELGGYRGSSVVFEDVGGMVAAYFVSIVYPIDVLGNGLAAGGLWIGAVFLVGALLVLVALWAAGSVAVGRIGAMNVLLVALFVGGCALLVVGIPWAGWEPFDPIGELLPPLTPSPYPLSHTTTGLLLGGASLVGGLWALYARPPTSERIDLPTLVVCIVWFAIPLVLYVQGYQYLVRTGYASIVPLMAILSILLVSAVRELRASGRTLDPNAVLVGIVLLVLVPQAAASPLFHPYDGWQESGEVNRMVFNGLEDQLAEQDDVTTLRVRGLPSGITSDSFPGVRSVVYPGAQATGSWLKLSYPGRELAVHNDGRTHLQRVPEGVSINTTRDTDTLTATLHYEHNDTERVASYRSHERRASATAHSFRSVVSSR